VKIERTVGSKITYSEVIGGRKVHATTTNGERGAARIFDIYRQTGGVARTPAITQNLAPTGSDRMTYLHTYEAASAEDAKEQAREEVRRANELFSRL
jgi:hypothetical protein